VQPLPWPCRRLYLHEQLHNRPVALLLVGRASQTQNRRLQAAGSRGSSAPVPVLNERAETFWWDTGNYFWAAGANAGRRPDEPWHYHYSRTLPGYPTFMQDADR
jgi:hypothetical protein